MKLSVAIATHNEEDNITRTLKSVYDWVDEIVIVDGESTDKTVELIKQFEETLLRQGSGGQSKIQIFRESNQVMFHINKQKAIERCTGEWILQLDADEVVSDELKKEIQSVIEKPSEIAYWIPRLNYFLGKPLTKGGQYPDYTIRLYKNGVARFPCRDVHEQVEIAAPTTRNDKAFIGHLKSNLLHYPYKTFDDYLTKWMRYCDLEAQILFDKKFPLTLHNFFLHIFVYPDWWFVKTYVRNRGYVDGFAGFVFSLFSALRYRVIYVKLYERYHR